MDPNETHQQQQNRNAAAALAGTTSTSQAMHDRLSLSLRQPQPQQALMFDGSPYSVVATQQQPSMQRVPRTYALPDVIDGGDSVGGANTQRRNNALGEGEGGPLTVHVIEVNPGEDISTKLLEFIDQEPRNVCILSATGYVSRAAFDSNTNRIGVDLYQGEYVIVDMSVSPISLKTASDGTLIRTASLFVSLAGPDCKVVGGCVASMLEAGSQVKVIVGTFGPGLAQSEGPQRSSESSEGNASTSLGNTTPQPPHHLPLWPGNFPQ